MRILNFAKRNFKEIIRDPLSIVFAIILPPSKNCMSDMLEITLEYALLTPSETHLRI